MEVKISVIMGVYQPRSRQILFQAVLSICSQTFSDWELIMVDDGTHDEGRDWIDQASLLDARIRLIRLPRHKGLSTALNAAIAASRGSYIARMDADDLSAPHRLQRLYDFLQAHAQYAWAGCCCRLVDEDGAWGHVRVPQEPCARDFLPHSPYIHPSVMFRTHALADGYCEARSIGRSEDYELFMRLHAAGLQGANVQEYLYLYREDRNSYHRRSFPHALREARTRGKGFAALGLPSLSALPYVVKPLFVAMTPPRLHWRIKQRRYADDIMRFRRVMARMPLMAVRTDSMKRLDQYAYAVFGPVLCGFVIWVLKEAPRRGIRTLYFLSRDGWMMAEAAKRLCGALGVRMEIRYLYCSRLSLHRAYAHIDMEKALRLLLRPSLQMTPRSLIARTMLPAQQQEACLRQLALPCGPDAPLTPDQGDELRKRLCSDPAFVRWMSAEAKAAYDALQGYLKQEGLEEGAYAIVDSGWIGSLQMTLSAMCEAMGLPQPQGFYFGLSRLQPGADPAAYHAYFFSPSSDLRRRAFFVPALFEAVYGAPHGMCAGYRQEAGRWVPVCLKQDERARRWAKALGAQISAYADQLATRDLRTISDERNAALAHRLLYLLMVRPTAQEAAWLGALRFGDDPLHQDGELAPEQPDDALRAYALSGRLKQKVTHQPLAMSAWPAGSVRRCHPNRRLRGQHLWQWLREAKG